MGKRTNQGSVCDLIAGVSSSGRGSGLECHEVLFFTTAL